MTKYEVKIKIQDLALVYRQVQAETPVRAVHEAGHEVAVQYGVRDEERNVLRIIQVKDLNTGRVLAPRKEYPPYWNARGDYSYWGL